MNQTYRIYTRWLAVALRKRGFKILKTDINEYHPEYTVWIFENNEQLQQTISELTQSRKRD